MKKYFRTAAAGLVTGALLFLITNLTGCFATAEEKNENALSGSEVVKDKNIEEGHSCCSEVEIEEFSDNSIYQLESEWTTQSGKKIELGELRGKPVVLTMFFASCTYACPILINDMKKIEASLKNKSGYKFVLVSIDPERDTPEKLMNLAINNGLDLNRWTLLTGEAGNVMELAALIGFKFKKDSNGEYSHSNLITLLNQEGEIIHQHLGLNKDIAQAVSVLTNFN